MAGELREQITESAKTRYVALGQPPIRVRVLFNNRCSLTTTRRKRDSTTLTEVAIRLMPDPGSSASKNTSMTVTTSRSNQCDYHRPGLNGYSRAPGVLPQLKTCARFPCPRSNVASPRRYQGLGLSEPVWSYSRWCCAPAVQGIALPRTLGRSDADHISRTVHTRVCRWASTVEASCAIT